MHIFIFSYPELQNRIWRFSYKMAKIFSIYSIKTFIHTAANYSSTHVLQIWLCEFNHVKCHFSCTERHLVQYLSDTPLKENLSISAIQPPYLDRPGFRCLLGPREKRYWPLTMTLRGSTVCLKTLTLRFTTKSDGRVMFLAEESVWYFG